MRAELLKTLWNTFFSFIKFCIQVFYHNYNTFSTFSSVAWYAQPPTYFEWLYSLVRYSKLFLKYFRADWIMVNLPQVFEPLLPIIEHPVFPV